MCYFHGDDYESCCLLKYGGVYSGINVLEFRRKLLNFRGKIILRRYGGCVLFTIISKVLECVWNLMAHGDAREGKWRGNWRMGWVASILTLPRNVVYPALLPLMRTPRLPAVDWTDAPDDLNGLVRSAERRNLVSARVPSRFECSLQLEDCLFHSF